VSGICTATSAQWIQEGLSDPFDLVVDLTHLYWIERGEDNGVIASSFKQGGPVKTLAIGQQGPQNLLADDTHLYWANVGGAIMRVPKDGSAAASLVTVATSSVFAVDDEYVYVQGEEGVDRVEKAGGTPMPFAPVFASYPHAMFPAVKAMLIDEDSLYVAADANSNQWHLLRVDRATGDTKVLYDGNGGLVPMLGVDAENVYFTDIYDLRTSNGIRGVDKANGGPERGRIFVRADPNHRELQLTTFAVADCGIFWTQTTALYLGRTGHPNQAVLARGKIADFAADATTLYWTDGSGAIGRTPKP
jgi:hypothetical protein